MLLSAVSSLSGASRVRSSHLMSPSRRVRALATTATAEPDDKEPAACELIGEEPATGVQWWACEEPNDALVCEETEFGVGGGPGILPQDGQVLCKSSPPKPEPATFFGVTMPWDKAS
mmetsp:Transcript_7659/g.23999  ORF Transcript_7659/g.23999 Transcript_7659/m.23999 type:complete len:117 (-) Transcript_7659:1627-1977(-)